MTAPESESGRRRPLGLGTKIVIGILAGVLCGLFFGERVAFLGVFGDMFVGLLQMTVLPFIMVALVSSIGRLGGPDGATGFWTFLGRTALVIGALMAAGLALVALLPLAFPDAPTASFFSVGLVEPPQTPDFLSLYVPVNVFRSLADGAVPAVVLFAILMGVGLAGVKNRKLLLDQLDVVTDMIVRVNRAIIRLTPIGVFAIAASTAGTMETSEFGRLQAYLLGYTVGVVVLTLVLLPAVVCAFTPFRYAEVFRAYQDPILTVFATGKVLVVLPMLVERTRRLFEARKLEHPELGRTVDVVYPLAYPFPSLGKVLTLLFIPFTAWFFGKPFGLEEYPRFLATGSLTIFGGPVAAVPFLLNEMRLPSDMFKLFLLTGVYTERLGDVLGVFHLVLISLLVTCWTTGMGRFSLRRLGVVAGTGALAVLLAVVGLRAILSATVPEDYAKGRMIASMRLVGERVPYELIEPAAPNPAPLESGETRLERIGRRGKIRIGYEPGNLPFTYLNRDGELVGLDADLAHQLALSLGAEIEFVPFRLDTLREQLAEDHFDLAMAGVFGSSARARDMFLTAPYLDVHLALVVRDHRAREFSSMALIRRMQDARIAVLGARTFRDRLARILPDVTSVPIESVEAFFDRPEIADALLISAEAGSSWTLIHPEYEVVVPVAKPVAAPLVYPVGGDDDRFREYLNQWIDLRRRDGTIGTAYDHWILGRNAESKGPRWNILTDVLRRDR